MDMGITSMVVEAAVSVDGAVVVVVEGAFVAVTVQLYLLSI